MESEEYQVTTIQPFHSIISESNLLDSSFTPFVNINNNMIGIKLNNNIRIDFNKSQMIYENNSIIDYNIINAGIIENNNNSENSLVSTTKTFRLFNFVDLDIIEGIIPFHDLLRVVNINSDLTLIKKFMILGHLRKSKLKIIPTNESDIYVLIHKIPNFCIGYLNTFHQSFQVCVVIPSLYVKNSNDWELNTLYKSFFELLMKSIIELEKYYSNQSNELFTHQLTSLTRALSELKYISGDDVTKWQFKCDIQMKILHHDLFYYWNKHIAQHDILKNSYFFFQSLGTIYKFCWNSNVDSKLKIEKEITDIIETAFDYSYIKNNYQQSFRFDCYILHYRILGNNFQV